MDQKPNTPAEASQSSTRRPALYTDDLDLFDTITAQLGVVGTAAQRFHGLISWVQQQREAPAPANSTTPDVMLPVVSDQAKTLAWLTDEIRGLRQQLTEAQQQHANAQEEISTLRRQIAAQQDNEAGRAWRSERSIMQAKIDSLTSENQTLRHRLERFDSLRQVLMADGQPQSHNTSLEASLASPVAPGATEESDSTIVAPPAQRRPHSAQERAARIWQAVREWNEAPGRPQAQKVALSTSTLEKRFGLYRPAAQQFMAEHHNEIEAHAQAHTITAPTHNRGLPESIWETIKQMVTDEQ